MYCREEIILCTGTFGSPRILMLSGLGPRDTLERLDIPVQVELPGESMIVKKTAILCEMFDTL